MTDLADLLASWRGRRAVVVGDVMLDAYVLGTADRLSPEAPVPVVRQRATRLVLGGAANAAAGLAHLGLDVELHGVVGEDEAGQQVEQLLADVGVTSRLERCAGRPTTVKQRVLVGQHQLLRIDVEPDDRRSLDVTRAEALEAAIEADCLVISDYAKGVCEPSLVRELLQRARHGGTYSVVDPKRTDLTVYAGCSVITPNRHEAIAAYPDLTEDADLATRAARDLSCAVALTAGADGIVVAEGDGSRRHPALGRQVFDVTGAGDTVVAVLAASGAAGVSLDVAVPLANLAASVAVGRTGTSTVSPEDLLAAAAASPSWRSA